MRVGFLQHWSLFGAYRWMRGLVGADVMEKTSVRQNECKGCMNWPLHVGTSIEKMYISRDRSADVNILGSTLLLARKSKRISV